VVLCEAVLRRADRIADLDVAKAPKLRDLARGHGRARKRVAAVEDANRGHLALALVAEAKPVARVHGPREHPDVRDLLAGRPADDLEHASRDRPGGGASRRGQQPRDPGHDRLDAGPCERRAGEDGMHERVLRLYRQLSAQASVRNAPGVHIRGEDRIVGLREDVHEICSERGIVFAVRQE
jgi:hypothetical protein